MWETVKILRMIYGGNTYVFMQWKMSSEVPNRNVLNDYRKQSSLYLINVTYNNKNKMK